MLQDTLQHMYILCCKSVTVSTESGGDTNQHPIVNMGNVRKMSNVRNNDRLK